MHVTRLGHGVSSAGLSRPDGRDPGENRRRGPAARFPNRTWTSGNLGHFDGSGVSLNLTPLSKFRLARNSLGSEKQPTERLVKPA
jgi:hypothetical protein